MVGGLKIIQGKPGQHQQFEKIFTELRSEMWEPEAGCLLFSLLRSCSNPSLYTIQEQYKDVDAQEAHNALDHVNKYAAKLRKLMDSVEEEVFELMVESGLPKTGHPDYIRTRR